MPKYDTTKDIAKLANVSHDTILKVEEQIAKEAKERQRQAGGDKVSEKAKAVASNLTEAVAREREPETAEIMAKKMGFSKNGFMGSKTVEIGNPQNSVPTMLEVKKRKTISLKNLE